MPTKYLDYSKFNDYAGLVRCMLSTLLNLKGKLAAVSHRAQLERQRDPGEAVENQINPDEEADHPKS